MTNRFPISTYVLFVVSFSLVLFFSSFHLFESPQTWTDEGLIIQSAEGLLRTGKAALPVAPGVFDQGWYITTGYPVTLPIAGMFSIFGVSLETARLVMLAFLICFFAVLFLYSRRAIGGTAAWFGFFLLVFFGPLYGNGRNVLGEIPGLLFIVLALFPLIRGEALTRNGSLWIGAWAGLAVATKPIFILLLPALLLALFLHRREFNLGKVFAYGSFGVLVPIVVWMFLQFEHVTVSQMLSFYVNNLDINVWEAIMANLKRLLSEMQPLYFLITLIVWSTSYGLRRLRHEAVSISEEVLLFFCVLIFLAYIRTIGYYRYFFPAQVFTILYLPRSLWYLTKGRGQLISRTVVVCLCGLVLFHAYQTAFRSWTALHYDSTRTQDLERYFSTLPTTEEIFVYQAPEVVPFVGKHPMYQYEWMTPATHFGDDYVPLVTSGTMPRVITPATVFQTHKEDVFSHYAITEEVESYVILTPK